MNNFDPVFHLSRGLKSIFTFPVANILAMADSFLYFAILVVPLVYFLRCIMSTYVIRSLLPSLPLKSEVFDSNDSSKILGFILAFKEFSLYVTSDHCFLCSFISSISVKTIC